MSVQVGAKFLLSVGLCKWVLTKFLLPVDLCKWVLTKFLLPGRSVPVGVD